LGNRTKLTVIYDSGKTDPVNWEVDEQGYCSIALLRAALFNSVLMLEGQNAYDQKERLAKAKTIILELVGPDNAAAAGAFLDAFLPTLGR
jgi:hypothetical protein